MFLVRICLICVNQRIRSPFGSIRGGASTGWHLVCDRLVRALCAAQTLTGAFEDRPGTWLETRSSCGAATFEAAACAYKRIRASWRGDIGRTDRVRLCKTCAVA